MLDDPAAAQSRACQRVMRYDFSHGLEGGVSLETMG